VPLLRITCPECGAGLKSSAGFTVGKTITCPKCEADFVVEEPEEEKPVAERRTTRMKPATKKLKVAVAEDEDDEDDEEERPKKKKKKKKKRAAEDDEEEEWSYKNSWIRYAVLGVLLTVLAVLGYMLREKWKKEANEKADGSTPAPADNAPPPRLPGPDGLPPTPFVQPGAARPGLPFPGPPVAGRPGPGQPPPAPSTGPGLPPIFGGPEDPAERQRRIATMTGKLAGTWRANLGNGVIQQIVYRSDGTYTDAVTGGDRARSLQGTWKVAEPIGNKGLKLNRTGGGLPLVKVVFEDDELLHDTDTPGLTGVFRKV
jgi:uncharacterized Zn finger protein (UPF0148 family)